jgi:hypothetical protein
MQGFSISGGTQPAEGSGHTSAKVLGVQSLYYLVTGLWPLIHLPSFEAVTGPKTDDWLVHMVGLLAATIGGTLGLAVLRREITGTVRALAVVSALAFAAIDVWYGFSGRIASIYLADAAVELVLVILILQAGRSERLRSR